MCVTTAGFYLLAAGEKTTNIPRFSSIGTEKLAKSGSKAIEPEPGVGEIKIEKVFNIYIAH